MRFAIAAFVLPFMFYTSPEILLLGSWIETLHVVATALIAIYLLAVASEGQLNGSASLPERLIAAVAALLLLWSSLYTDLVGLGLTAGLFVWSRRRSISTSTAVK